MRPTQPFIALSIGAVIALSPVEIASSQPASLAKAVVGLPGSKSFKESLNKKISKTSQTKLGETLGTIEAFPSNPVALLQPVSMSSTLEGSPASIDSRNEVSSEPLDDAGSAIAQTTTTAASASQTPQLAQLAPAPTSPGQPAVPGLSPSGPSSNPQAPSESLPLPMPNTPAGPNPGNGATSPPASGNPATVSPTQTPPGQGSPAATGPEAGPAPEYLYSDPNPLAFPTRPQDVQIVGTQPITLQQSLELAQRNSEQLRIAQLQLDRQRSVLDEARAALYPTLEFNSNFTGTENSTRQSSSLTNRFAGIDPIELNWSNTLQLAYDLGISGQRSAQIRAAEAQVRFQELQVETVAEQLRLDVSSAYYDLQQADEQVRISRATLEQSLQNLRDTQALERAGVGTRFDVLSAQVDVANSQQDLNQRLSDQQTARRQLARLLIIPENVAIVAADPVRVAEPWTLSLEDSIVLAYRNRAELEQQLVQREINDQQRQVALSSIRPNISVFANYNANNQLNAGTGFNNFYQFGAQLRWSIFDGGSARAQAAQQERNIEIAESQFADNRSQVRFQVEQAYNSLQSNSANIGTTTLALSQAQEALRLARLRFQAGVGTQTDVLRSQTDLTRAEVNQVNAIIGYNRSLVQLKRAISNWPQGNLAESP